MTERSEGIVPKPTGRVGRGAAGAYDMVLTRTFRASIDDVWASVTEPDRTVRWFGAWRGEPGPGRTVEVQMGFEEGAPWCDLRIEVCEPPRRLAVSMLDEAGDWRMEVRLTEDGGVTTLELVHHLADPGMAENAGPGWEYYLDMLVAARDGRPLPDFADYFPAQADYFAAQARVAG
ncbi:SRPBCC family protein [Polymorphospora sp. NPDC051019]|uniref:SRPBCC family protein n=1 Tax=Polymorphospora sp. NPDC051019 TaxID=3155725 RepID=UPI003449A38A